MVPEVGIEPTNLWFFRPALWPHIWATQAYLEIPLRVERRIEVLQTIALPIWLWDQVSRHFTSNGLMRSVPDEPPWCQGLLLTARDLVFGVIDFGLYYTLLTNLYFVRFGTQRRSRTYVKGLEDPCTIRYTSRAYKGILVKTNLKYLNWECKPKSRFILNILVLLPHSSDIKRAALHIGYLLTSCCGPVVATKCYHSS